MNKSLEQKLVAACVQYCYNLCVDDDAHISIIFDKTGVTEGEVFDGFEQVSQKHNIYLDEASPGTQMKQPWMTDRQVKILELHDTGMPTCDIGREMKLPWGTIYRTIKKYRGKTNINPKQDPRQKKPKK